MWKRTAVATAGMTRPPQGSGTTATVRFRLEEPELLGAAPQTQLVPDGSRHDHSFSSSERPAAVRFGLGERPLVKHKSRRAGFLGNRLVGDELDLAKSDAVVDEPRLFGELHRLDL